MTETNPYAYAKACGIIGRSFVGKRISSLAGLRNLNELDRLIFPDNFNKLPASELLSDLERRIVERTLREIMVIANSFSSLPELVVRMLRVYEYNDLKACIQNIAAGKKELPPLCDIGRFGTINFKAFPDLSAMLKNTEFEYLLFNELKTIDNNTDINSIETIIDVLYYHGLINSLSQLSAEDRFMMQQMLASEISLHNCAWALRLRTYYHKRTDEIGSYMIDLKINGRTAKAASLAAEALESLDFHLDARNHWEGWKWEKLLNSEMVTLHWTVNPRYFQNAAAWYLYKLALKGFHRSPLSISAIFCYIRLKQFEEDLLTSVAEGLALGLDSTGVFEMLEGTP